MITKIWHRNGYKNVKPENPPKDTRELDSFLSYNGAPKCFLKGEGGWYKVTKQGLNFVSRTLYLYSLAEWLEFALDENFIANTK